MLVVPVYSSADIEAVVGPSSVIIGYSAMAFAVTSRLALKVVLISQVCRVAREKSHSGQQGPLEGPYPYLILDALL